MESSLAASTRARSVVRRASKQGWYRLRLWHLCSLDAPSVALAWAALLARLAHVSLSAAELLVLALGTWLVYVLDRILDGFATRTGEPPAAPTLQQRHYFHRRHRHSLLGLASVAACTLSLAISRLPARLIHYYLLLGLPVALYCASVHRRLLWPPTPALHAPREPLTRSPPGSGKEAAVALLFAAAVAGPALAEAPPASRPALGLAGLLLALLCWLNCLLITHAERSTNAREHRQQRLRLTRSALALAWLAAILSLPTIGPARLASIAVLLSCLLLLALLRSTRATPAAARVLADLSLLTPLLFLLPHFG